MAADPPDPGDDLTAAEAAMADTRRALAGKLDALRDKLVALATPSSPERTDTVPPKTAKPAASSSKTAKPAAKKPAAGKTAPGKAAGTKSATATKAKPAARRKKPTLAEAALNEVREVAKDVLTGAAAGAVRGAATAAAGHVQEGAEKVDELADRAEKAEPKTKKPAAKGRR